MTASPTKRSFVKLPLWPALASAFVVPGAGQILNRDIKKGLFLFVVFVGSFYWCFKVLTEQLSLLTDIKPETWQQHPEMIQEQLVKVVNQNPDMFLTFQILIILVWGYSVIDAYLVAKHNLTTPPPVLTDETSDTDD